MTLDDMPITEAPPAPQHPAWRRFKYVVYAIFVVLTDSYGIATTLLLALKYLLGEQSWVVGLFNSLFPSVLLPALVMLPGSLYIRRWRLALFTLPALATFILNYAIFFLPRGSSVPPDAPQFTLLTYNLHSERTRLDAMVSLVRDADADIVLFQEFVQPAAERFEAEFADEYAYRELTPVGLTVHGKGILSRYPILSVSYDREEGSERLMYQRIELDVNGTAITIYNVHPSIPRWLPPFNSVTRSADIARILESASKDTQTLLIAGDFNMTDQSDDYHSIAAHYADTYREVGFGLGLTYPDFGAFESPVLAMMPQLIRLDHVFHSEHFAPVEAHVWPASGRSDHRPLLVRLALVRP